MKKILILLLIPFFSYGQDGQGISNAADRTSRSYSLGSIFNETSFASTSRFPITGSSITRGTNKIDLTGNPTLFADFIRHDDTASPHKYTGLEVWSQKVRVKTPTAINGTSYGIGIGVKATTTHWDPFSTIIRWAWDTGGPTGKIYLYNKETTAGQQTSVGTYVPTAATYYWIEVQRIKNLIRITIYSDTNVTLFEETMNFSLSSGFVQAHNVGQFAIYQFGGTANEVTNWEVSSGERKWADYCFVGDSNMNLWCVTNNLRWPENAATAVGKSFTINAGIADRTADIILKLPEIIALRPTYVFLSAGRNDVANSVVIGTIQTNINTIISTLEQAGIVVKLGGVIASTVDVSAVQTHYTSKSNTQVNFYTDSKGVAVTTLKAAYDGSDAIHLNGTGHAGLSTLTQTIL